MELDIVKILMNVHQRQSITVGKFLYQIKSILIFFFLYFFLFILVSFYAILYIWPMIVTNSHKTLYQTWFIGEI